MKTIIVRIFEVLICGSQDGAGEGKGTCSCVSECKGEYPDTAPIATGRRW